MPKLSGPLFDTNSDSETEIRTENEYAKNYDAWRKKEEFNKLKTKYGEDALDGSGSSSSSEDDEDAVELTEKAEKDFFKTLSYLKKKDPKIYDSTVTFFENDEGDPKKVKTFKEQPMYLKDYERKLLLEKGGVVSDEEEDSQRGKTDTQELEGVKLAVDVGSDDEGDGIGGIFKKVQDKVNKKKSGPDSEHLKWLGGQSENIKDNKFQTELKPLKDFWNGPNLDNREKFLRDYILNKKYLEKEDESYIPSYDEIVHDSDESLSGDEKEIEKQEEFEHKYNFRFEEPDQEFNKRYPRTIEHSLRKTDDRRKLKRAETKERKIKEKEEKMAEIRKLQELKRKEIEEKLEKLKEVTGQTELAFDNEDLDGDFDPEAHDQKMQALFNDEFYEGHEGDQKPMFPEIDQELEIENWDQLNEEMGHKETSDQLHCEDEDFNMDADYDPSLKPTESKGKKKRKRQSKVLEALKCPKPKFDPNDKDYEKYFEEYYKLDCEDIIGDIPCRFKYRQVVPNDFGLSVEEILLAKDKELNKWCSLKKAVQRRPEHVEKYDQIAYAKKASNVDLKRKLLPSLFIEDSNNVNIKEEVNIKVNKAEDQEGELQEAALSEMTVKENPKVKEKQKKKNYKVKKDDITKKEGAKQNGESTKRKRKHSDKNQQKNKKVKSVDVEISDARLAAFGFNPKKYKNKLKYGSKQKN